MSKKVKLLDRGSKALEHLKDILPHLKDMFLFGGLMYVAQANVEQPRFKLANMLGTAVALESLKNSDWITALAAKGYITTQLGTYTAKAFLGPPPDFDVDTSTEVDKWRIAVQMRELGWSVLP